MTSLRGKLNSRRGASFILAILFFLICGMIASVIVSAATANSGRTAGRRDEAQAYLSVSSAARLIKEELAEMGSFTATRIETEHTCGVNKSEHEPETTTAWQYADTNIDVVNLSNSIFPVVLKMLRENQVEKDMQIANNEIIQRMSKTDTLSFSITVNADEFDTVNVLMTIDEKYNLIFKFTTDVNVEVGKDGQELIKTLYSMVLSVPATELPIKEEVNSTGSCSHNETTSVLVGGEFKEEVIESVTYPINTITHTATVTWLEGTLSKGVKGNAA